MRSRRVRAAAFGVALALGALEGVAHADAAGEDDAADATLLAAQQFARAGDLVAAEVAYRRFVDTFGSEPALAALERADRVRYRNRIGRLQAAHEAIFGFAFRVFDYRGAAAIELGIANQPRLLTSDRRDAANNAARLYAADGDEARARVAAATFAKLEPTSQRKAEVDFAVANLACADTSLRAARERCLRALTSFYESHHASDGAEGRVVQASYRIAKAMQVDRDPNARSWCRRAMAAFDRSEARAPHRLSFADADAAAECAFTEIDAQLPKALTGADSRRYEGEPDAVAKRFDDDLRAIGTYARNVEGINRRFLSPKWNAAGFARVASLYDAVRAELAHTRPPGEPRLVPFDDSWGSRDWRGGSAPDPWSEMRRDKMNAAAALMIPLYARAVLSARAWHGPSVDVDRALKRLGFFEAVLGDERMRRLTQGVVDPATKKPFVYEDGMFFRARSGQLYANDVDPLAPPLPFAR